MQLFKFEAQEVRTVVKDDEVWFVAKDVCDVLGIKNVSDAVSRLDKDEKQSIVLTDTLSRNPNMIAVNEFGLYSLINTSRKPEAKKFQRWINHEVLPSIRKYGAYLTPATIEDMLANPDVIIQLLINLKDEQHKRKEAEQARLKVEEEHAVMEMALAEAQPKVTYYDTILDSHGTHTITEIAQDYDLTAQKLNEILKDTGVQYKQGRRWLLTKNYQGMGLIDSKTIHIKHGDFVKTQMRWTVKGRLFIHQLLQDKGILAVMDKKEIED